MRRFIIVSNTVNTSESLSLNSLTGYGRLDVLCRCISAAFFLSNSFRKDVILEIYFQINEKLLEIQGDKVRGINPDERAIAGVLKRVFEDRNHPGIRFYNIKLTDFLEDHRPVVLDINGEKSTSLLGKFNTYLIGDQLGFLKEIRDLISPLPKLTLGNNEYLSSQTITILNYILDNI